MFKLFYPEKCWFLELERKKAGGKLEYISIRRLAKKQNKLFLRG